MAEQQRESSWLGGEGERPLAQEQRRAAVGLVSRGSSSRLKMTAASLEAMCSAIFWAASRDITDACVSYPKDSDLSPDTETDKSEQCSLGSLLIQDG